jgi:hypothetical protein
VAVRSSRSVAGLAPTLAPAFKHFGTARSAARHVANNQTDTIARGGPMDVLQRIATPTTLVFGPCAGWPVPAWTYSGRTIGRLNGREHLTSIIGEQQ